jgi:transcription initiation factor TFIID subunit 7
MFVRDGSEKGYLDGLLKSWRNTSRNFWEKTKERKIYRQVCWVCPGDARLTCLDLIDVNPGVDVPDSYYIEYDPDAVWYHNHEGQGSEFGGSEMYDDPGSVIPQSELDEQGYYDDRGGSELFDGSDEDGFDDDLAAALREELADVSDDNGGSDAGDGSGDDEDEEGARSGDDEEDEDLAEKKDKIKQFTGEIKILETTIEKKRNGFTGGNPIMVKRFEETIAGLQADVNTKVSARQTLLAELDSIMLAKAQAAKPPAPETTPAASLPEPEHRQAIAEDEEDGEDDVEGTGPDTPTPDIRRNKSDDDEDLFGDDDDYDESEGQENADSSNNGADLMPEFAADESSSEPEPEMDEELAALLEAELNQVDAPGEMESEDAATLRELQDLAVEGPMDNDGVDMNQEFSSSRRSGFGVEGGVGMRRLANGLLDDGTGSSSDSDDSDD